jgi:peptidoglycan hydrolase-like protein with peptidoglycan-binding domain
MPLLKKGSKGRAVKMLQAYLGGLTIDGEFGNNTLSKVKEFQRKNNLNVDGEVGPKTWNAIIKSL